MYVRMTPDVFTCLVLRNTIELLYSQFYLNVIFRVKHVAMFRSRYLLPIRDALSNPPLKLRDPESCTLVRRVWSGTDARTRAMLDDLCILSDRVL